METTILVLVALGDVALAAFIWAVVRFADALMGLSQMLGGFGALAKLPEVNMKGKK